MITSKPDLVLFLDSFKPKRETISLRFNLFKELLLKVDFNKVLVYIEDVLDEVYISFSLKNPDFKNSGELMFFFRDSNTKIYLYGKKIKKEDKLKNDFIYTLNFAEKLLIGNYCLNRIVKNTEVVSYEVTLDCFDYNGIRFLDNE